MLWVDWRYVEDLIRARAWRDVQLWTTMLYVALSVWLFQSSETLARSHVLRYTDTRQWQRKPQEDLLDSQNKNQFMEVVVIS